MFLLFISFAAGILTVLAPCVLPLLPIIVGGSVGDGINIRKALTVVSALGISVIAFTFILKVSTLFITIPPYTWTLISGGIIVMLGIVTVFPTLWETTLMARLSAKSNMMLGRGNKKKNIWGDIVVGASLGPVFSTCSPTYFIILATILPVQPVLGMLYLFVYTLGLCGALFLVSFIGQKILNRLSVVTDTHGIWKRALGVVFIIVGLAILTGVDKKVEAALSTSGIYDITKVEQHLLQTTTPAQQSITPTTQTLAPTMTKTKNPPHYLTRAEKDKQFIKAPELVGIDGYINTDGKPITLADYKGKVILLDIWTYSCINCQRTLPYVTTWYGKYKDQGFVVIGVHTPEFSFEKVQANVQKAVEQFGIQYPVVLDNEYATWRALGNQYWPRKYLIDSDGYIVYDHAGEGNYDETEKAIQNALQERADTLNMHTTISTNTTHPTNVISVDADGVRSPETYFGSARNTYLDNGTAGSTGQQNFTLPTTQSPNRLYLGGPWNIVPEYAENTDTARIEFTYSAKNVYMAAGSDTGVTVSVYRDDVLVQKLPINDEKLYTLINGTTYGTHTLRIEIPKAGLKAFTFTFG